MNEWDVINDVIQFKVPPRYQLTHKYNKTKKPLIA